MDLFIRSQFDLLHTGDIDARYGAYQNLMAATRQPVSWAYEVWDELLELIRHDKNHIRAIATQVLSQLAKSDPDKRMEKDFESITVVTYDKRFVTARHTLQTVWKIAVCSPTLLQMALQFFQKRFDDCATEKNCTLIRYDIIEALRKIYNEVQDPAIQSFAIDLASTERDEKYRKKYLGVWKDIIKQKA
jgi:hypothetical protein